MTMPGQDDLIPTLRAAHEFRQPAPWQQSRIRGPSHSFMDYSQVHILARMAWTLNRSTAADYRASLADPEQRIHPARRCGVHRRRHVRVRIQRERERERDHRVPVDRASHREAAESDRFSDPIPLTRLFGTDQCSRACT